MSLVTLRYGAGRISPFEAARMTGDRPDRGRQEVISNCCCEGIAVYHFSGVLNIHMGKDDRISRLTATPHEDGSLHQNRVCHDPSNHTLGISFTLYLRRFPLFLAVYPLLSNTLQTACRSAGTGASATKRRDFRQNSAHP